MRTSRIAAALLCVAVLAGACSGDDDSADDADTTTDQPTTDQPTTEPAGDEPAADTATITIADFAFDGVTEVPVGTTVVVTNTDSAQHTWTALDGTFDSGALGQGDTFEFTFDEAGSFDYQCNFHPSMTGTIVVTA